MTAPAPAPAPSTAERIRSACARSGGAMLAVAGIDPAATPVHHLLPDGSFAITVPAGGALAATVASAGREGVPAVLEMTDYAPLPLREPVRSLVWIQGRLRDVAPGEVPALLDVIAAEDPDPALLQVNSPQHGCALLRLEIESVVVADATGAESVAVGALLRRQPGPVLRHGVVLAAAHGLGAPRRRRPARRPAADRPASRPGAAAGAGPLRRALRVEGDDGDHDVRLPFAKPVDDVQRTESGDPRPDGMPVPQRSAGAARLTLAPLPLP